MLRTRRALFEVFNRDSRLATTASWMSARGHEAYVADLQSQGGAARPLDAPAAGEIRLSSNEHPLGPGAHVIDAIVAEFPEAGRYPFNSTPADRNLAAALAAHHGVAPENISLGAGSQEILKSAVRAFTSESRPLVTASPTFENPTSFARKLGHPVKEVPVDAEFRLDLAGMAAAAPGAGLVFLNNPNNPTATVHSEAAVNDFVARVHRASPSATILIDEAYHEYVTDGTYATAVPLAMRDPHVIVARTFSKAYGMAGLRVGYAIGQADAIRNLARYKMPYNVSSFGVAAAMAALANQSYMAAEKRRNTDVRAFTAKVLEDLGCRCTASESNFLFVDIGRPARAFRDACSQHGVTVGRDFPPFHQTHARISIGTMDEMRRATEVFRTVLGSSNSAGR